jgi:hypothetical protein
VSYTLKNLRDVQDVAPDAGAEYLVFGPHHEGDGAVQAIEEFWP